MEQLYNYSLQDPRISIHISVLKVSRPRERVDYAPSALACMAPTAYYTYIQTLDLILIMLYINSRVSITFDPIVYPDRASLLSS